MAARAFLGVLMVITFILVLSLVAETRRLAQRVDQLEDTLPSKSDVAMLKPLRIKQTLQQNCASCHTDRQFGAAYGRPRSELNQMIHAKRALPGGDVIQEADIPRVEAALIAVRCTVCHDESVVGEVALMPREQRNRYLFSKVHDILPVFRVDEVHDLIFAFDVLLDEPIPDLEERAR